MAKWVATLALIGLLFVSGCTGSQDLGPADPSDTPPPPTAEEAAAMKQRSRDAMGEADRKMQEELYPEANE